MWIGAVISGLLGLTALLASSKAAEVAKDLGIKSPSEIDALRTALIVGGIVLLLIAAVDVLFALRIGKGGRTARMLYTILGGLGSLGALFSAISTHQASHWTSALMPLVTIGLLWLPQSSKQFFEQGR
jgi:hypothetical protein